MEKRTSRPTGRPSSRKPNDRKPNDRKPNDRKSSDRKPTDRRSGPDRARENRPGGRPTRPAMRSNDRRIINEENKRVRKFAEPPIPEEITGKELEKREAFALQSLAVDNAEQIGRAHV